jgi:hypothetical protein
MPATDVLSWAARKRISGVVSFEQRNTTRSLGFDDGALLWSSSNRREEQLGEVLRRSLNTSERGLADALETRAETGVPLGKVLLMSGLATEDVLVEILATKIRECVADVALWQDGTFELVTRGHPNHAGIVASVSIDIALTVAERRREPLRHALQVLGSDDAVFFVPPSANAPSNQDDGVDRVALWDYAGAHLSAAEMIASCMGERFSCLTALATMVNERRLVVDRRTRDRTNSGLEIAAGARGRLRQGDRPGAYAMAQDALRADPSSPEIHRMFATVERAHVAEIARRALSKKHAPKLRTDAPNDASKLTDLQKDLVDRIDGCWDLLSLLRSSGVREADALLAFDQLRALGFVE